MSFLAKIREGFSREELKREVRFDAAGLTVSSNWNEPISIRWTDVRQIDALKWDLFSYDEVCLEFYFVDAGGYVRVTENDAGFEALRAEMERRFAISTEWFAAVAQPPFVENRTTLWRACSAAPVVRSPQAPEMS